MPTAVELGKFREGFLEAALFAETADDGSPLDQLYSIDDFDEESLRAAARECDKFARDNEAEIEGGGTTYTSRRELFYHAGKDFWFTRNGHGAGFWDGDWEEPYAAALTGSAKSYGNVWVTEYGGSDGNKLQLSIVEAEDAHPGAGDAASDAGPGLDISLDGVGAAAGARRFVIVDRDNYGGCDRPTFWSEAHDSWVEFEDATIFPDEDPSYALPPDAHGQPQPFVDGGIEWWEITHLNLESCCFDRARFASFRGRTGDFDVRDYDRDTLQADEAGRGYAQGMRLSGAFFDDVDGFWFVSDHCTGSDYNGGLVNKSNYQVLLKMCEDLADAKNADGDPEACSLVWFTTLSGGHGTYALALHMARTPDEVVEVLEGLENYPLIDEEAWSQLESDDADEQWNSWAARDFRRELEKAMEGRSINFDDVSDQELRRYFEDAAQAANENWHEDGTSMYIDVEAVAKAAAEGEGDEYEYVLPEGAYFEDDESPSGGGGSSSDGGEPGMDIELDGVGSAKPQDRAAQFKGFRVWSFADQPLRVYLEAPDGTQAVARVLGVPLTASDVRFFDLPADVVDVFPEDALEGLAHAYGRELQRTGWFGEEGLDIELDGVGATKRGSGRGAQGHYFDKVFGEPACRDAYGAVWYGPHSRFAAVTVYCSDFDVGELADDGVTPLVEFTVAMYRHRNPKDASKGFDRAALEVRWPKDFDTQSLTGAAETGASWLVHNAHLGRWDTVTELPDCSDLPHAESRSAAGPGMSISLDGLSAVNVANQPFEPIVAEACRVVAECVPRHRDALREIGFQIDAAPQDPKSYLGGHNYTRHAMGPETWTDENYDMLFALQRALSFGFDAAGGDPGSLYSRDRAEHEAIQAATEAMDLCGMNAGDFPPRGSAPAAAGGGGMDISLDGVGAAQAFTLEDVAQQLGPILRAMAECYPRYRTDFREWAHAIEAAPDTRDYYEGARRTAQHVLDDFIPTGPPTHTQRGNNPPRVKAVAALSAALRTILAGDSKHALGILALAREHLAAAGCAVDGGSDVSESEGGSGMDISLDGLAAVSWTPEYEDAWKRWAGRDYKQELEEAFDLALDYGYSIDLDNVSDDDLREHFERHARAAQRGFWNDSSDESDDWRGGVRVDLDDIAKDAAEDRDLPRGGKYNVEVDDDDDGGGSSSGSDSGGGAPPAPKRQGGMDVELDGVGSTTAESLAMAREIVNPLDLPQGVGGEQLFRMWAGQMGSTFGYVWANGFEAANELWIEHLDECCPGYFVTVGEDELKEAAQDLGIAWDPSWPDWSDEKFSEVAEHAEADLTVIGWTTLKSGTHIPSDEWGGGEATDDAEIAAVWCLSATEYEKQHGEYPDEPEGFEVDCTAAAATPDVESSKPVGPGLDISLDGVGSSRAQESSAGFAISTYGQAIIEENAEERFSTKYGDPQDLAAALQAGLIDASGEITAAGWEQLQVDIERLEDNALDWLRGVFNNARADGHGVGDDLLGVVWFDPDNPRHAELIELASSSPGRSERIDMTDLSYGDLANVAFDGVSDFGGQLLGGAITFFDVSEADWAAIEATLERASSASAAGPGMDISLDGASPRRKTRRRK